MTPVPLELPLRPAEAAELANLIFDQAEGKPLTDEVRTRLSARAGVLRLSTITPYFGSLGRDPVHPSTYYLAVDDERGTPHLLHIAPANAPSSSIFHKPLLVGRMRRHNGPEMVINSIPFGPMDRQNVEKFAARIDNGFLPRPQGQRTSITVTHDAASAFDAFRAILKRTGKNLAAVRGPAGVAGSDPYYAALWAAIRAGWRADYTAGTEIVVGGDVLDQAVLDHTKEAIRNAASFTRFAIDTTILVREPAYGAALEDQFAAFFTADERAWIRGEFVRTFDVGGAVYELTSEEALHLAVKFGRGLIVNEQLHENIRQTRSALKMGRGFDFEPVLAGPALTTPRELLFCLHWLKARGHAAQLVAPNLGFIEGRPYIAESADRLGQGLGERVRELAGIVRHYQAILSVRNGSGKQPEVVRAIARATVGRVNYQIEDAREIACVAGELLG